MERQSRLGRLTGIVFSAILFAAIFAAGCSPQGSTAQAEASTETTQTTETTITTEPNVTDSEQASAQPTEVTSTDAQPTALPTEIVITNPTETPLGETAETATATDTISAVGGTALTTQMHVNMRACPGLNCGVVGSLPANVQVVGRETVEGERYENIALWWKIDHEGREAYIHSSFLK